MDGVFLSRSLVEDDRALLPVSQVGDLRTLGSVVEVGDQRGVYWIGSIVPPLQAFPFHQCAVGFKAQLGDQPFRSLEGLTMAEVFAAITDERP
jgi:hypothetical protein